MSDYGDRSKAASHFNRRQPSNPFLNSSSESSPSHSTDTVKQDSWRDPQSVSQHASFSASADSNPRENSASSSASQPNFDLSRWLKSPSTYSSYSSRLPTPQRRHRYSPAEPTPPVESSPDVRREPQPPQFPTSPSANKTASFTVSRPSHFPRQTAIVPPNVNQLRPSSPSEQRPGPPPSGGSSKVTPIRPKQQVWPPSETRRRSRDRRPPQVPRRPKQSAPQPILYVIRILILGVGVAAIAGTLLSILRPEADTQPITASQITGGQAALSGLRTSSRGRQSLLDLTLPLADELVYLKQDIEQLVTMTPGLSQSVFVLDLDTGNYVDVAGSEPISAASTIKTPILVAFLQNVDAGLIQLDQGMTLQSSDIAGGSGNMQTQPVGAQYTVWEVASQMIINSDNTATNMMINLLGGANELNQRFRSWGLTATEIRSPLPDLDGNNKTSTRDLASLMELVNRGDLLSLRSRDRLLSIMQRTRTRTLIPSGLARGAIVANKTGDIGTVLGDMALVDVPNGKRYAIATLIQRPHNDGRARELIRRISQLTYKELNRAVEPVIEAEQAPVEIPEMGDGLPGTGSLKETRSLKRPGP
ncbi:MAG: serine hydrolase [Leptolyngbyaceae cyanobacterium MO_188.B28]|nr:serine hydrolase [Leptolyngbyaceae cyanobacterium MO_188.B28]